MRTARALIVMPFSRSRSMESSTCSAISRALRVCVRSSKRSARVDLPWSMCAIMQKLRMNCWFMPRQHSITGADTLVRDTLAGDDPGRRHPHQQLTVDGVTLAVRLGEVRAHVPSGDAGGPVQ